VLNPDEEWFFCIVGMIERTVGVVNRILVTGLFQELGEHLETSVEGIETVSSRSGVLPRGIYWT
jgi:hypothetical protein